MIIVKFGGSVITDKNVEKKFKPDTMKRLSNELASIEEYMILVHGAGSFGHILAKQYELHLGYKNDEQALGLAIVQRDVRELNLAVMNSLLDAGINCVSIEPSNMLRCSDGQITEFDDGLYEDALALGLTPVSFGDVVLDDEMRFCICSGDLVMQALASCFLPRLAVFVADVDGIFRDFNDKDSLIGRLRFDEIDALLADAENVGGSASVDVTGGMRGKLEMIRDICAEGTDTIILNGNEPGRLSAALRGEEIICTFVEGKK